MESLPLLLLGCLAGLSVPWLWRRKSPVHKLPSSSSLDDELGRLHEGSVIAHDSVEYLVTRAGRLGQAGPWQAFVLLDGPQGQALLLVAKEGHVERLWLLHLCPQPGLLPPGTVAAAEELQVGTRRYRLSGRCKHIALSQMGLFHINAESNGLDRMKTAVWVRSI